MPWVCACSNALTATGAWWRCRWHTDGEHLFDVDELPTVPRAGDTLTHHASPLSTAGDTPTHHASPLSHVHLPPHALTVFVGLDDVHPTQVLLVYCPHPHTLVDGGSVLFYSVNHNRYRCISMCWSLSNNRNMNILRTIWWWGLKLQNLRWNQWHEWRQLFKMQKVSISKVCHSDVENVVVLMGIMGLSESACRGLLSSVGVMKFVPKGHFFCWLSFYDVPFYKVSLPYSDTTIPKQDSCSNACTGLFCITGRGGPSFSVVATTRRQREHSRQALRLTLRSYIRWRSNRLLCLTIALCTVALPMHMQPTTARCCTWSMRSRGFAIKRISERSRCSMGELSTTAAHTTDCTYKTCPNVKFAWPSCARTIISLAGDCD